MEMGVIAVGSVAKIVGEASRSAQTIKPRQFKRDLEQTCDDATLSPDVVSTDISNCPFLIIAIASKPANVRRAVRNPPNPSPGLISRLIRL
jgi:hypothetical protein